MNQVYLSVLEQLDDALIYLPKGCLWAAGITISIIVVLFLLKIAFHRKIHRAIIQKIPVFFLFITYIYCVLQLTVFSRSVGNYGGIDMRFLVRWNEWYGEKAYFIANIIMFVPMGIFLPMLCKWTKHLLVALPAAVLGSIAIEAVQLKYQLGFCQLDDVVANSTGFFIGFLIYLMIYDAYLFVCCICRGIKKIYFCIEKKVRH